MKRATQTFAVILMMSLIAACGGDDKAPPPKANTKAGNEALPQLQFLSAEAKAQCCQAAAPFMVQYAQSGNPFQPPPMPKTDGCKDAIMNFETYFRTIDNGDYANSPDAQKWRDAQGKGVINCVGDSMKSAGFDVSPNAFPKYFVGASMLVKDLQVQVPSLGGVASPYLGQMQGGGFQGLSPQMGNYPGLMGPVAQRPITPSLASSAPNQFPFNNGTQVLPYLPQIPMGY